MIRIAVTAKEYDKAEPIFRDAVKMDQDCLRAPAGESELAEFVLAMKIRHVIVGVEKYIGSLYKTMAAGGVIARFGVGHDGINKDLATQYGLLCTNTPGVLDDSVAELTMSLILAAARHIVTAASATRGGQFASILGHELAGKTLAIIGCGSIGRRVARIAVHGFGMRVIGGGSARKKTAISSPECGISEIVNDYHAAVADAHYVSLHIPGTSDNCHFINRERLSMIPSGAWLINTSRGSVIDESALYDAVADGRLAGAALDVYENEPYRPVAPDKDLRSLANVLMTPHVGSSTHEACRRMAERALHNIRLAEARQYGEMDLLNPDVIRSR